MRRVLVIVSAALAVTAAPAAILDIDIAGWEAYGNYGDPGNSFVVIPLPVGASIDNAEYIGLSYTAEGYSWRSELTLSLNDGVAAPSYWDTGIAAAPGSPGSFGPVSAAFANPGLWGSGPFVLTADELYVTVYDTYDDSGRDQFISAGTIRVHWTPEPGSLALLGLGALGLLRRR